MKVYLRKENWGILAIGTIVIIPIIIWIFIKPLELRFVTIYQTFTSIGQILGLLGLTTFAVTLFLSARIKWLEQFFGGLDCIYRVHHKLGVISFIFLLMHPLFLAANYVQISLTEAALFFLPRSEQGINMGIIALLLMMVIILITLFGKMRYETLRRVHATFGIIFFLGGLHSFVMPSDISQNMILRLYMLTVSIVAFGAFVYWSVLGKILVPRYEYIVREVNILGSDMTEVVMEAKGKKMQYEPGQFIFISFDDPSIAPGEVHPFSISSSQEDPYVRVTIKALGDFTAKVNNLSVGSHAKIEGPFGYFSYLRHGNKKQVWIAGGVGVAPFVGMAKDLLEKNTEGYSVDLYYSVRTREEMIRASEFEEISQAYPGFRFIPYIGDESDGYLTVDIIAEKSQGVFGKDIYICGPPIMMQSLIGQFIAGGVPKTCIHSEEFRML